MLGRKAMLSSIRSSHICGDPSHVSDSIFPPSQDDTWQSPLLTPEQQAPTVVRSVSARRSPAYTRSLSEGERSPMVNVVERHSQLSAQSGEVVEL